MINLKKNYSNEDIKAIQEVKNWNLPGQSAGECENICEQTIDANKIDGDMVEIGVHSGGSARIIEKFKSNHKNLYLFDTFDGLQDCNLNDLGGSVYNGFAKYTDIEQLRSIFTDTSVHIIQGYFPESAPEVFQVKKFSLVHLDTDTYQSTLNCLHYFYEKLSMFGIIIVHDYINNHAPGVKKAVDEFLQTKTILKISKIVDSQATIIKQQ